MNNKETQEDLKKVYKALSKLAVGTYPYEDESGRLEVSLHSYPSIFNEVMRLNKVMRYVKQIQFTGKLDINGKEIQYNSDIVEFEFYEEQKGFGLPAKWITLKGTFASLNEIEADAPCVMFLHMYNSNKES